MPAVPERLVAEGPSENPVLLAACHPTASVVVAVPSLPLRRSPEMGNATVVERSLPLRRSQPLSTPKGPCASIST